MRYHNQPPYPNHLDQKREDYILHTLEFTPQQSERLNSIDHVDQELRFGSSYRSPINLSPVCKCLRANVV